MILRYAPVLPEVKSILNKSSTYINRDGKHPELNSCIIADRINTQDGEWTICINDPNLSAKMKEQIATMQMYKDVVKILS